MKANELMIGDWVSYTECEYYRKVSSIDPLMERVGLGYMDLNTFPSYDYCDLHDVNPIPLTPEILEKNGWYFDDLVSEWYSNNKAPNLYGRDCSSLSMFDGSVVVGYVHELQQALRLCGLNDLADNFKV